MHCNQCPFLHQVSRAKRSFAFISGSASLSNSKRAVMEMVGSPAAGIPNIVGDAAAAVVVAKSEGELHPGLVKETANDGLPV